MLLPLVFYYPGAGRLPDHNVEWLKAGIFLAVSGGIGEAVRVLLADAQTSGGLLIAVPPDRAPDLVAALQHEDAPTAAIIGRVTAGTPGRVAVV